MTTGADGTGSDRRTRDQSDLGQPWQQVRWVIVDVEVNGQHPPDLLEAACVPVDEGVLGTARTWLVRPPRPITLPIQRLHGIANADVAASPSVDEVAWEIRAALAGRVVVGHHVGVDLDVLGRELGGWAPAAAIDTWHLAKAVWPDLPSYRLDDLTAGHPARLRSRDGYRAGHDAVLTAELFLVLASAAGTLSASAGDGPVSASGLMSLASATDVPTSNGPG